MPSKIFVGNLDFKATRGDLESLFAEAGEVQDVFIPTDRNTGRPRGFAFVEFSSEEEAEKAIELFDEHELGGRNIRVNIAEERRPRAPSFGAGDGPSFDRGRGGFGGKPKGSRRNIRGKKRSL